MLTVPEEGDHPLSIDFHNGITSERAAEIAQHVLHPSDPNTLLAMPVMLRRCRGCVRIRGNSDVCDTSASRLNILMRRDGLWNAAI